MIENDKTSLNFLVLADSSSLLYWMIDRLACGFPYEVLAGEAKSLFGQEPTEAEYAQFKEKYSEEITKRNEEMKQSIRDSNTYSKLIKVSDKLYDLLNSNDFSPKDFSAIASTLKGYIETISKLDQSTGKNVAIKQQNNFLILKGLQREGLIEINDASKLKYMVDGEYESTTD